MRLSKDEQVSLEAAALQAGVQTHDFSAKPGCFCIMHKHRVFDMQNEGKLLWLFNHLYPWRQLIQSSASFFTQHNTYTNI